MPNYQVLEHGVLVRTLPSLFRLKEYIKQTYATEDIATLLLHGIVVREVK